MTSTRFFGAPWFCHTQVLGSAAQIGVPPPLLDRARSMGGKDSKPKEAAGGEPPAQAAPPAPKPASPKAVPAKPAEPAPAAKAAPAGPIGDPSAMKLVVPANDPAALKCLIAASARGVAVYQVAGEVRVHSCDAIRRRSR